MPGCKEASLVACEALAGVGEGATQAGTWHEHLHQACRQSCQCASAAADAWEAVGVTGGGSP